MQMRTLIILAMLLIPGLALAGLSPIYQERNLNAEIEIFNTFSGESQSNSDSHYCPDMGTYDAWSEAEIGSFMGASGAVRAEQHSRITSSSLQAVLWVGGEGVNENPDMGINGHSSSHFEVIFELDAPHGYLLSSSGTINGPGFGEYLLVDSQGMVLEGGSPDEEPVELDGILPAGTYTLMADVAVELYMEGEGYDGGEIALDVTLDLAPSGTSSVGHGLASNYLRAGPNPMTDAADIAFAIGRGGPVIIEVLDMRGHRVRTFAVGGGGEGSVHWDGRTASGRQAPSGTYFLRARSGERVLQSRVTLVR